jgi:hypothetical protein
MNLVKKDLDMKIKLLTFLITTFLISYGWTADKVGTTSFQFLKIKPDARSAAMGNAFVSVANSANAVFWNPGALTRAQNIEFSGSYYDYFVDVNLSAFAASIPLGNWGTIGVQVMLWDYGSIEVTSVASQGWNDSYTQFNPGLTGETINPSSQCFGLTFARELTDKFSFGMTAKAASEDLVKEKESAILFDGGLLYRTGFRSLYLAASVRNFGSDVTYINESYPLPQTFTFGFSTLLIDSESPFLLASDWQRLLVAYDVSHPRDYDQQHNMGIEYVLLDIVALRAGYKFNYDEETMTYGAGLYIRGLRFDYAYEPFGEILDSVHKFTLSYGLK